jgi:hypothetical protein
VQPGDRVFVSQPWGSWFEWAVPDARYFVDSRIELFPAGVWSDYDTVANGSDGWQAILDEDDVGVVAVGLDSPLRPLIAVESGWCTALEGGDATLYLRQPNGGGRACP